MDGSDESSLIARARDGDREAFRQLVERHARSVFRLSYRLMGNEPDAEDVVQETFLKAYRSLGRYEEGASFGAWLYRIASNCALDAMRRRKRRPAQQPIEAEEGWNPVSTAPSPERIAAGAEASRRLRGAMGRLSSSERTAFVLRHVEGRSVEEIARTLGVGAGAARHAIFRAVAKLRAELGALRASA